MDKNMDTHLDTPVYYIEGRTDRAGNKIGSLLTELYAKSDSNFEELVFLCIGSDRITGDSLGPLIGHRLAKEHLNRCCIYGTLANPVHALNLQETVESVKKEHPNSLTVAIDASLGSKKHQGFVTVGQGSLEPGLGVKKKLPPVGDISITGIVNLSGAFEHFLLRQHACPQSWSWRMPSSQGFWSHTVNTSAHAALLFSPSSIRRRNAGAA